MFPPLEPARDGWLGGTWVGWSLSSGDRRREVTGRDFQVSREPELRPLGASSLGLLCPIPAPSALHCFPSSDSACGFRAVPVLLPVHRGWLLQMAAPLRADGCGLRSFPGLPSHVFISRSTLGACHQQVFLSICQRQVQCQELAPSLPRPLQPMTMTQAGSGGAHFLFCRHHVKT